MKHFFIEIQNFWAWADKLGGQIGQIYSGAFGVFSAELSAPMSMFSIIQPLFLQKTKLLYPRPKHLFGIEV